MSTILDALKKVEQQRSNLPENGLPQGGRLRRSEHGDEARSGRPRYYKWIVMVSAVVLVAGLSAAGWVYFKSGSSTTPPASTEAPMQRSLSSSAQPPSAQADTEPTGEKTVQPPPASKVSPAISGNTKGPVKMAAKSEQPAMPAVSMPEPPPPLPTAPPPGNAPPRIETAPPPIEMAAPRPDAWDAAAQPPTRGTDGPDARVDNMPSSPDMSPAMVKEALEPSLPPPEVLPEIVEEDINPPPPPPDAAPEAPEPSAPTVVPSLNDPNITLQALAWTAEPERRMVVINGSLLREGDSLGPYTVGRIEKEQVVLLKGGVEAAVSISRLR